MPHPDQKKKVSDEEALRSLKKGELPDLPTAFKAQAIDAEADDERSMFKRVERPEEETETELPDPFAVTETQAEPESEAPEQTRDQTELLQQIVMLLEQLPNEIGDSVADALGVNQ